MPNDKTTAREDILERAERSIRWIDPLTLAEIARLLSLVEATLGKAFQNWNGDPELESIAAKLRQTKENHDGR